MIAALKEHEAHQRHLARHKDKFEVVEEFEDESTHVLDGKVGVQTVITVGWPRWRLGNCK